MLWGRLLLLFCKKYIGSCCGNRFVIVDCRKLNLPRSVKIVYSKKVIPEYGVDSALFVVKSRGADLLMEVFEQDGSESDSCGNGTILIAYILKMFSGMIEMKDNAAMVHADNERQSILMSSKLVRAKKICGKENCYFVKVGEPHVVILVDSIDSFDLVAEGERLQVDYPGGVNVDVLEKIGDYRYRIRTYERGVFSLTKSCGTGSLSSFVAISCINDSRLSRPVELVSDGGRHWVSRSGTMIKLETMKSYCEFKELSILSAKPK